MNRRNIFYFLGIICLIAAVAMYIIGNKQGQYAIMLDFWWAPLLPAALLLIVVNKN